MRERTDPDTMVRIRRAREEEWSEFRGLRLRALALEPFAFGSTLAREQTFPPETWKERLAGGEASTTAATWAAVEPREKWVGMITFSEREGAVHVFAMWVDPVRRGAGVGGRLLDAGLSWVAEHHPGREVVLDVNPNLVAAVRLYESRGFRPTGVSAPLEHTPSERTVAMVRSPSEPKSPRG